jgi:two-component system copper resistance phosphate regulon response regulator CusR
MHDSVRLHGFEGKMRVLVVEDEPEMRIMLRDGLREHGHTVAVASDGQDGLSLATQHEFDLVLLDVILPGVNGYSIATALRSHEFPFWQEPFILMLTACDAEDQIICGLECGADDYLTKPFSFLELLARIKATTRPRMLMRNRAIELELDPFRQSAYRDGNPIPLTPAEYRLLECLVRANGQTVTRTALIESVWGRGYMASSGNVETLVNTLRNKVDLPFRTRLIHTARGIGYRLCADSATFGAMKA